MEYEVDSNSKIKANKLRKRLKLPKHSWFSNKYILKNWGGKWDFSVVRPVGKEEIKVGQMMDNVEDMYSLEDGVNLLDEFQQKTQALTKSKKE